MLWRIDLAIVILGLLVACLLGTTDVLAAEIASTTGLEKIIRIEDPFFTDELPARKERPTRQFDTLEQMFTELRWNDEAVLLFESPSCLQLAVVVATWQPDWPIASLGDYLGVVVPADDFAGTANDSLTVLISLGGCDKPFPIKQRWFTFVRLPLISEMGEHGEGLTIGVYQDVESYMRDNIYGYPSITD